jgi:hypothetical protein
MNASSFIPILVRKMFIAFYLFTFIKSAQAQSIFNIIPGNSITSIIDCDSTRDLHFYIENPNQKDILLQWKVKSNTLPMGTDFSGSSGCWTYMLCDWQLCIFQIPSVNQVISRTAIKAQTNLNDMKLTVLPGQIKGSGTLVIEVFEKDFPSNSKTITWNVSGCLTGEKCTFAAISESEKSPAFTVYPNPAADFINVKIEKGYSKNGTIQVYDLMGELMIELNTLENNSQKIELKKLPAGEYFIKYSSHNGSAVRKFFKPN